MGIQDWSENIVLVNLTAEAEIADELKTVMETVRNRDDCDVVVDFSKVRFMNSSTIGELIRLHKLLAGRGDRLILCSVPGAIKGILEVTGLDGVFEFAEDMSTALTKVQLFHGMN